MEEIKKSSRRDDSLTVVIVLLGIAACWGFLFWRTVEDQRRFHREWACLTGLRDFDPRWVNDTCTVGVNGRRFPSDNLKVVVNAKR